MACSCFCDLVRIISENRMGLSLFFSPTCKSLHCWLQCYPTHRGCYLGRRKGVCSVVSSITPSHALQDGPIRTELVGKILFSVFAETGLILSITFDKVPD